VRSITKSSKDALHALAAMLVLQHPTEKTSAVLEGSERSGTLSLMAANNCAEFQLSPDGRCMVQALIPWVVFGRLMGRQFYREVLSEPVPGNL
jgi:hypothetical protein